MLFHYVILKTIIQLRLLSFPGLSCSDLYLLYFHKILRAARNDAISYYIIMLHGGPCKHEKCPPAEAGEREHYLMHPLWKNGDTCSLLLYKHLP